MTSSLYISESLRVISVSLLQLQVEGMSVESAIPAEQDVNVQNSTTVEILNENQHVLGMIFHPRFLQGFTYFPEFPVAEVAHNC